MASYAITHVNSNDVLHSSVELFLLDGTDGSINVTLPIISADGNTYYIKRIDTNVLATITLTAASGETINNAVTRTLNMNEGIRIVSYNHNYIIL